MKRRTCDSIQTFLNLLCSARTMAWLMIGVGVLSGLSRAGGLALINHVLHHPSDHSFLVMLGFVVLVAGKLLSNLWSQLLLVRFSQDTILDLSLSLCAKIVRAPLRRSEQRGAANILVTLTDDVSWVTWAIQCFLIDHERGRLRGAVYLALLRGARFWVVASPRWARGISDATQCVHVITQPARARPNYSPFRSLTTAERV